MGARLAVLFSYMKIGVLFLVVLSGMAMLPSFIGDVTNDHDLDGLDDELEEELGTDPNTDDTDGDRLSDAEEYHNESSSDAVLPDADPLRKDLYVQVTYSSGIEPLSEQEKKELEEIWLDMPVQNPSGETGIRIHINDSPPAGGALDERLSENFRIQLSGAFYDESNHDYPRFIGEDRQCTYHLALFVHADRSLESSFPDSIAAGKGDSPGYLVKIDGERRDVVGKYSYRPQILTHELLHNIVGEIENGEYHTEEGWLSHENDEFLSDTTSEKINENGFNESEFYDQELC